MITQNKLMCALCIFALLLTSYPSVLAAEDVEVTSPSFWATEEVEKAVALGMVPDRLQADWQKDMTRGEFAELAIRFLSVQYGYGAGTGLSEEDFWEDYLNLHPDPNGQPFAKADYFPHLAHSPDSFASWNGILDIYIDVFRDVDPYTIGARQINLAYLMGIVEGRDDGRYDPDGIITRQEAAALLARTYQVYADLEAPQTITEPFSDSDEIAPWAQESVTAMQGWGVLQGDEEGALQPNGHYTREQGIITMMRLYQNMPISRFHGTLSPLLTQADVVEWCKRSGPGAGIGYQADTEICTILYVAYGGMMRPPSPNLYLIYSDSTYKRIDLTGPVWDFQLIENDTKLTFTDETPRILDLQAGIYVKE